MSELNMLVLLTGFGSIVATYAEAGRCYAMRNDRERMALICWAVSSFSFSASCTAFVIWLLKTF